MDDENKREDGFVSPEAVKRQFDPDFKELASKKDVKIVWDAGMHTQAVISGSSSSIPLYPQNT